jgi:asparagine N-glycosylation enzyme membrane subunit Stt3
MIGFLSFLLVLIGVLALMRVLPVALLAAGYWWLWSSHRWVLIGALIIGAALGIVRALRNQSESQVNHPRYRSTALPTRHGIRRRLRRGLFH